MPVVTLKLAGSLIRDQKKAIAGQLLVEKD